MSHGVAELPPLSLDASTTSVTMTLSLERSARTVTVSPGSRGRGVIKPHGKTTPSLDRSIMQEVRHVLRLDEDLSPFYVVARDDPDLAWVCGGAGRMIRSQTVFEDVVKTVCTTNCAWSATERMVGALVEHLGRRAPGAPQHGVSGRAFPTPEAMADAGENFYRETARAGYRGAYLLSLSRSVASGDVSLEELAREASSAFDDDEVERRLLELPGVGPYAAAHVMMMLGRYSRLILDSWSRPKYARLLGRKTISDRTIVRRFKPFGPYAGLAFWLFITRDWIDDQGRAAPD